MNLKNWYTENYPTDILRLQMNSDATFEGLFNSLSKNVYDYIGIADSLIRERLFEKLSTILEVDYKIIYNIWLNN